jgi:hypothetical protein
VSRLSRERRILNNIPIGQLCFEADRAEIKGSGPYRVAEYRGTGREEPGKSANRLANLIAVFQGFLQFVWESTGILTQIRSGPLHVISNSLFTSHSEIRNCLNSDDMCTRVNKYFVEVFGQLPHKFGTFPSVPLHGSNICPGPRLQQDDSNWKRRIWPWFAGELQVAWHAECGVMGPFYLTSVSAAPTQAGGLNLSLLSESRNDHCSLMQPGNVCH